MSRFVAIYRSPVYSPLQHRLNDTAIMDATVAELEAKGWRVRKTTETQVERGRLPAAKLYLNMCQGSLAATHLMPLENDGAVVVNRPWSAMSCHRHRMVERLGGTRVAFPRTLILASSAPPSLDRLDALARDRGKLWIKRGDVHAERPEDVVAVPPECVKPAIAAFAARGIPRVVVQEHVPGPVIKFYGVADGWFFRWYGADAGFGGERPRVDEGRLTALAGEAAAILGLEVFGGDVALPQPDRPVLIDINDWPSFAPFREEAAQAIGAYVIQRFARRHHP